LPCLFFILRFGRIEKRLLSRIGFSPIRQLVLPFHGALPRMHINRQLGRVYRVAQTTLQALVVQQDPFVVRTDQMGPTPVLTSLAVQIIQQLSTVLSKVPIEPEPGVCVGLGLYIVDEHALLGDILKISVEFSVVDPRQVVEWIDLEELES
jgi:hypothetical protein